MKNGPRVNRSSKSSVKFLNDNFETSVKDYSKNITVYSFIKAIVMDCRYVFALYFLCSIGGSVINSMLVPIFSKKMISALTEFNGDRKEIMKVLYSPLSWLFFFWLLGDMIGRFSSYIYSSSLELKFEAKIKITYLHRILSNCYSFFVGTEIGSITGRFYGILYDTLFFIKQSTRYFLPNILTTITLACSFFAIHYQLGILMLFHFFLICGILYYTRNVSFKLSRKAIDSHQRSMSAIVDSILNIFSVILLNNKKFELNVAKKVQNYELNRYRASLIFLEKLKLIFVILAILICGLCFWVLQIHLYKKSLIDISDIIYGFTCSCAYLSTLYDVQLDLSDMVAYYGQLKRNLSAMNEGELISESFSGGTTVEHKSSNIHGDISFNNVSFGYKTGKEIFKNKNFTIKEKSKVGIVGKSGSGKTTLINLVMRNIKPTGGTITLNGVDMQSLDETTIKNNIAVISQETMLFNRSVFDNIRYGKLDATYDEVIEAAKKANAHEFIVKMPLSYYSSVGEKGSKLSGGQRQRIIIARAILKNAPILILDEATSALDAENEHQVQNALKELIKDKTVIAIAHRIKTLIDMDYIYVFEDGKIIESGDHEELTKQDTYYNKLWKMQN